MSVDHRPEYQPTDPPPPPSRQADPTAAATGVASCSLCCLLGGALTLGADGRPVHLVCAALLPAVVVTGPGQRAATAPFNRNRVSLGAGRAATESFNRHMTKMSVEIGIFCSRGLLPSANAGHQLVRGVRHTNGIKGDSLTVTNKISN